MGIVNLTPDSFHAGSRKSSEEAVEAALAMWNAGATWVDIGGESTRPGAELVSEQDELERVIPVIEGIQRAAGEGLISVDTRRASVAAAAFDAGATMLNDVSGLRDPAMFDLVLSRRAPVCIMHMQGEPSTMQAAPDYVDCVQEVVACLHATTQRLIAAGHPSELIVLDPGIGFGKLLEHNISLLQNLDCLRGEHQLSVLVGTSRKSMIAELTGRTEVADRLAGTLGTAAHAQNIGVDILRVHDVAEHRDLSNVIAALNR